MTNFCEFYDKCWFYIKRDVDIFLDENFLRIRKRNNVLAFFAIAKIILMNFFKLIFATKLIQQLKCKFFLSTSLHASSLKRMQFIRVFK